MNAVIRSMTDERWAGESDLMVDGSLDKQHFLYFLPLPQGHGSFREFTAAFSRKPPLTHGLLANGYFAAFSLPSDSTNATNARTGVPVGPLARNGFSSST